MPVPPEHHNFLVHVAYKVVNMIPLTEAEKALLHADVQYAILVSALINITLGPLSAIAGPLTLAGLIIR